MKPVHFTSLTQDARTRPAWGRFPRLLAMGAVAVFLVTATSLGQTPKELPAEKDGEPGVSATSPEFLPGPTRQLIAGQANGLPDQHGPKSVPITLDTIFRLAEAQNAQIGLARARVDDASAQMALTAKNWLPNLYIGMGYYRHDGGIANEDGTMTISSFNSVFPGVEITSKLDLRDLTYQKIVAERSLWQNKGELSRIASDTLVDASSTYVDMVTARTNELIALEIQSELQNLSTRTDKLAETEVGTRVIAARVHTALAGVKQSAAHARVEFARAAAKLIYLLGLDPCATLVPLDKQLIPLELVDANVPCCELVAQVLAHGPGIQETQQIIALAHQAIDQSNGAGRFVPVFEAVAAEGGFGTGPGDDMTWANRLDIGLRFRWNLTDLAKRRERQCLLHAKAAEAHYSSDDLRGKLAASVEESRDSIILGREQIDLGRIYVDQARGANKLARDRMMEMVSLTAAHDEVLLSLQALATAQVSYLNAIRDYDKAQLRLLVLLGSPNLYHHPLDNNCPLPVQQPK